MRLVQLTDTHLFDRRGERLYGVDTAQTLAAVIAMVRAREPRIDAVLATGDLIHDGGTPAYRHFMAQLAVLEAPVYCLPGNHDNLRLFGCALKRPRFHPGRSFETGSWQVLMLNSAVHGAVHGHLSDTELDRLNRALEGHPGMNTLVCLHQHPMKVGSAWLDRHMLDNDGPLFATLSRHSNARAVLCGHVHQSFDAVQDGIRVIASPSTCVQFKPGCADFSLDDKLPGYRWLELGADGTVATGVEHLEH